LGPGLLRRGLRVRQELRGKCEPPDRFGEFGFEDLFADVAFGAAAVVVNVAALFDLASLTTNGAAVGPTQIRA
jgi:hypothetical protein